MVNERTVSLKAAEAARAGGLSRADAPELKPHFSAAADVRAEARTLQSDRHLAGEAIERRRQLRGLLVLATLVIVLSVVRAGVDRVFPSGWWRLW